MDPAEKLKLENQISDLTNKFKEQTEKFKAFVDETKPKLTKDSDTGKLLLDQNKELSEKLEKMNENMNTSEDKIKTLTLKLEASKKYDDVDGLTKSFTPENATSEQKAQAHFLAKSILKDPLKDEFHEKFFKVLKGHDAHKKLGELLVEMRDKSVSIEESYIKKDLSTTIGEDGGYSCPPSVDLMILKNQYETSPVRQFAKVVMISKKDHKFFVQREEPTAVWEDQEVEPNDPKTDTQKYEEGLISTHTLSAQPIASLNVLEDSVFNLQNELLMGLTNRFARAENTAFIKGEGGVRPQGLEFYAKKGGVAHDHYAEPLALEQIALTGSTDNADWVNNLEGALFSQYKNKAVFIMNRPTKNALRQVKDSNGQYLFSRELGFGGFYGLGKIRDGMHGTLLGYPVWECDDLPSLNSSTSGTHYPVYFGDFSSYCIVDRLGMIMIIDDVTRKGWRKFYTRKRVGAGLTLGQGIKVLKQTIS